MTHEEKTRMLRGYLKSRKAIERFLAGDSGREFVVKIVGGDMRDSNERLQPYEASLRDWFCAEINHWVSGGSVSLDDLDAVRKKCGGVLMLESWD